MDPTLRELVVFSLSRLVELVERGRGNDPVTFDGVPVKDLQWFEIAKITLANVESGKVTQLSDRINCPD